LAFFLPSYYRERIRSVRGVLAVAPMTWFGGQFMNDRPENFFAQFSTDPEEIVKAYPENIVPDDQLAAWKRDRAGCMVDARLARKMGWKLGDRVVIKGTIFPVDLELTIRAIYTAPVPSDTLFFDHRYLEEAVPWAKGQAGFYAILTDSPQSVSRVAVAVDDLFHNSPQPTKTETEKAFQLDFLASLGNVKGFILGISGAVVFATLLVTANTMGMSIRERTREVAVMKALGFTQRTVLAICSGEGIGLALLGGVLGSIASVFLVKAVSRAPQMAGLFTGVAVSWGTIGVALAVAVLVGFLSGIVPSYAVSRLEIVRALRHIG
jgi:putative ABC transport system permease protein